MNRDNDTIFNLYVEAVEEQPQMDVDVDGTKRWRLHDVLHREDGPAIEYANGTKAWWLHGKRFEDAQSWAKTLLQSKNEPSDEQHVEVFLHNLNKKKVNELM